jgi:chromosome partitioning protein
MTGETKKTPVIALCSVKGGVGKTYLAILLANFLAAAELKVCVIDTDLNNSLSFYYLDGAGFTVSKKLNIASALGSEENRLKDFVLATKKRGIGLIASTPYLSDLRGINEKRLARMMPGLSPLYDAIIVDCHPTYDNIVLNAVNAADYIITPVLKDTFCFNTAKFLGEVLSRDTDKANNWFVLLNGYNRQYENARGGKQKEFIDLFGEFRLTPKETWIPWTAAARDIADYGKSLTREKSGLAGTVRNAALYDSVYCLAESLLDGGTLPSPEAF